MSNNLLDGALDNIGGAIADNAQRSAENKKSLDSTNNALGQTLEIVLRNAGGTLAEQSTTDNDNAGFIPSSWLIGAGDNANLTTNEKTTVIGAVNEISDGLKTLQLDPMTKTEAEHLISTSIKAIGGGTY